MLIDWFTVAAQIINFLILVWLLKRFLYKPILSAMDKREKMITDNLQQASIAKTEAETERSLYLEKNGEFERQQNDMLKLAKLKADQEQQNFLNLARKKVEEEQADWENSLVAERRFFYENLQKEVQRELFLLAEQFLTDLANTHLEEQLLTVFSQRLQAEIENGSFSLTQSDIKDQSTVVIRSTFDLSPISLKKLEATLQLLELKNPRIVFENNKELLCGLEIVINGQKISWNAKKYLETLKQEAENWLEREKETHGEKE